MTETVSWPMNISYRQDWPTVHVVDIHIECIPFDF